MYPVCLTAPVRNKLQIYYVYQKVFNLTSLVCRLINFIGFIMNTKLNNGLTYLNKAAFDGREIKLLEACPGL
jgi:hypothetical protein